MARRTRRRDGITTARSRQPLGGWLPHALRPAMAAATARSLIGLALALPHLALPHAGAEWSDIDTPAERRAWEEGGV